jgi:hypothetical protein
MVKVASPVFVPITACDPMKFCGIVNDLAATKNTIVEPNVTSPGAVIPMS